MITSVTPTPVPNLVQGWLVEVKFGANPPMGASKQIGKI